MAFQGTRVTLLLLERQMKVSTALFIRRHSMSFSLRDAHLLVCLSKAQLMTSTSGSLRAGTQVPFLLLPLSTATECYCSPPPPIICSFMDLYANGRFTVPFSILYISWPVGAAVPPCCYCLVILPEPLVMGMGGKEPASKLFYLVTWSAIL